MEEETYKPTLVKGKKIRRILSELADIMGASELCSFAPKTNDGSVYGIETKDEKLYSDIGFVPEVSFPEGIGRIIRTRGL